MRAIGAVLHSPRYYDSIVKLFTLGRERAFREEILSIAKLRPGDDALDVGCGTGTLAIAIKEKVGSMGNVSAIDASEEMIDRARRKATKRQMDVTFHAGLAQSLPFTGASFDVVFATLMLHHLPRPIRSVAVAEMKRVLRPAGKILIVDFGQSHRQGNWLSRIHRHGHVKEAEIESLVTDSGLVFQNRGRLEKRDLFFIECAPPGVPESSRGA